MLQLARPLQSAAAGEARRRIQSSSDPTWFASHSGDAGDDPRRQQAVAAVRAACRTTGTIPGYASSTPEEAILRAAQGFQVLTLGSDLEIVLAGARTGLEQPQ